MRSSRPSSPAKQSSLPTPKSTTTLWTARLVATLWKLAVKRARKLRAYSQSHGSTDILYGTAIDGSSPTPQAETPDLDEASIMQEAARSVVASGVVSLADLEAVTGLRLSKMAASPVKDDDASSEAATDTSDCCSDVSDGSFIGDTASPKAYSSYRTIQQPLTSRRALPTASTPSKWVCVGYGRYVKAQQ
jgi:hypothetical protein